MRVRVAAGARKHGITTGRIRAALDNAELVAEVGDQASYIGVDDRGVELELIVVSDDQKPESFTVIHAMPTGWRSR